MKKRLLPILVFMAMSMATMAQYGNEEVSKESPFKDRLFTGGGFGMGFGNIDWVNVSPIIGYRVNNNLAVGLGGTYRFTNIKFYGLRTNDYGGSVFARYLVRSPVFLQAEYEYLNFEYPISNRETIRLGFNSILGGAGIAQPLGRRAAFIITALYNFSYVGNSLESPYDRPWVIRGGVTFGF